MPGLLPATFLPDPKRSAPSTFGVSRTDLLTYWNSEKNSYHADFPKPFAAAKIIVRCTILGVKIASSMPAPDARGIGR
jgi:hypothetical protein